MSKCTFVVSDETINSYGFSVLTAGIDTAHFEKNPVMFYMHNRESGIIGRWENIRKDGAKLLADAVFDNSTDLARQVQNQVANGFLRSASIGIDHVTKDVNLNGVETVIKCRLVEISIVDIPSNENAVKLYKKTGGFVYDLASYYQDENNDLCGIDYAVKRGYITAEQRDIFARMAKNDPTEFAAYIKMQQQKENDEICALIDTAIEERKIWDTDSDIYKEIGNVMGAKFLKRLLPTLNPSISLLSLLKDNTNVKEVRNLDWYRKNDPETLRNNPELYNSLILNKYGTKQRNLD